MTWHLLDSAGADDANYLHPNPYVFTWPKTLRNFPWNPMKPTYEASSKPYEALTNPQEQQVVQHEEQYNLECVLKHCNESWSSLGN